jgi:hypothetical protein
MGVCSQRDTERASQTKICQLEIAILVDEQVLRLKIAMQHTMSMAIPHTLAQLHHKLLHHLVVHAQTLARKTRTLWQRLAPSTLANRKRLHVLLQIQIQELKDEV